MQVGKVGAYSMYVRKGEQIVRQRQNSSNYGDDASRTSNQQERRARWGNIVNVFKALKSWQPKAWETAVDGRTDYNEFMSKNINSSPVFLTKDMCANGCAVMASYQVSQGSLAPVEVEYDDADGVFVTSIATTAAHTPSATLGQVSADIISSNPEFVNGDNIAIIFFSQQVDGRGYPYLRSRYFEITLDTSSEQPLSANPVHEFIDLTNTTNLAFTLPQLSDWTDVGIAVIHTRKASGLAVSTQRVVMCSASILNDFSTADAATAAIESYGVSSEVPLEPSFNSGHITQILVDGVPVNKNFIYGRAITVDVVGESMDGEVVLKNGSAPYVPLQKSIDGNTWTFILTQNGEYSIYDGEKLVRVLTIEGVSAPAEFLGHVNMALKTTDSAANSELIEQASNSSIACLNYQKHYSPMLPYFYLSFRTTTDYEYSAEDFTLGNCVVNNSVQHSYDDRVVRRLNLSPVVTSLPCYVAFKGFVVAVFNYSDYSD